MRALAAAIVALCLLALPASGDPGDPADPGVPAEATEGTSVRAWVSSPTDPDRRLLRVEPTLTPSDADVRVDPDAVGQQWIGTGAALTDASARLLRDDPAAARLLFGTRARHGARLDLLRLPLSPTDFSPESTTWGWDGTRVRPSREARRAVRVLKRRILPRQPGLRILGSPWSAPGWMKDSGTIRGGRLLDEQLPSYGAMLVAQVDWLRRHDLPVGAITLGNEPGHSSDYATMLMSDQQMTLLGDRVGPALAERGVGLWAVDHNWSDQQRYLNVLGLSRGFTASSFHCYRGHPSQMASVPGPKIVTECTGTTGDWAGTFDWDARMLIDGAISAGSSGLMLWNLALDPDHGPRDPWSRWGCQTCRGLLTLDGTTRTPGPEFYALAHLSRAAAPGSDVVWSDSAPGIATAAFRRANGTVGVLVQNGTASDRVVRVAVADRESVAFELRAHEFLTVRLR